MFHSHVNVYQRVSSEDPICRCCFSSNKMEKKRQDPHQKFLCPMKYPIKYTLCQNIYIYICHYISTICIYIYIHIYIIHIIIPIHIYIISNYISIMSPWFCWLYSRCIHTYLYVGWLNPAFFITLVTLVIVNPLSVPLRGLIPYWLIAIVAFYSYKNLAIVAAITLITSI
jgi:hypothetical protein